MPITNGEVLKEFAGLPSWLVILQGSSNSSTKENADDGEDDNDNGNTKALFCLVDGNTRHHVLEKPSELR
jgi:hypothetical protein